MFADKTTVAILWPEIALTLLAVWVVVGNALLPLKTAVQTRLYWTGFAVLAVCGCWLLLFTFQGSGWERQLALRTSLVLASEPSGPLVVDYFAYAVRTLALLAGLLLVLQSSRTANSEVYCEYLGMLLLAIVGVMLTASADELAFLFLGLEMISLPTYVLLFLGRRDAATSEATVKYFFLSIVSSAMLLYGFSFLYGMSGSTSLTEIAAALRSAAGQSAGAAAMAPVALVLIVAGLGFKIAAAPFHFYAPDVYQGATNANAGVLSVLPKIAGIVALVRLVGVTLPVRDDFGWQLAVVLAILTMTIGNVSALWQTNVRRMMAYSSIAHSGYMLIGLAAALAATRTGVESRGLAAVMLYLFVYAFATIGAFAALTYLGGGDREVNRIDDLAGVGKSRPATGAILAVCMFSLSGIPVLAGFWGKLALFGSAVRVAMGAPSPAVQSWFLALAIAGLLNAAVAAAYYLRIVGVMYFRASERDVAAQGGWGAWSAAAAAAAIVLAVGILPGRLVENAQWAEMAARREALPAALSRVEPPADQRR